MKRIIFSDLHLHTWAYGATTNQFGMNSRLYAQYEALLEMISYAQEHDIKYIYFCGDMFHTHSSVSTQALMVAGEFFRMLKSYDMKLRVIPGNHDFASMSGNIHSLWWLPEEVTNGVWCDEGVFVHALPYTKDEDILKQFLEGASKLPDGSIILLHQGVAGVPLSSGWVMDERLTADMIPPNVMAFTGHYHFHKRVTSNLTVVGNLTPLNWNDIDQVKGWIVYDDETKEITQVQQTKAPSFRKFEASDLETDVVRQSVGGSFVRVSGRVPQRKQEEVRDQLVKLGGLTVEFTEAEEAPKVQIRAAEEITLDHLVKSFEKKDMEPRRIEVGKQVREMNYVQP